MIHLKNGSWHQTDKDTSIPCHPRSSCGLGKVHNLSKPKYPDLNNGNRNTFCRELQNAVT